MNVPERLQETFSAVRERTRGVYSFFRTHTNVRTVFILAFLLCTLTLGYTRLIAPPRDFPTGHLISVPEGATLREAAQALKEQRVIASEGFFVLSQRLLGRERTVHAGDYLFKRPASVFAIGRALALGAYGLELVRIRIPEGATVRDIADIVAPKLERFDADSFIAHALPLEGALFPDTYFFLPNATDATVLSTMTKNFDAHMEPLRDEIISSGRTLDEIIIMASLLEREARIPHDRRMIAGVLWNRIDKDMLLQVDAAFLYTLGKGTFDLTLDDLRSDSPYNTYKFKGLPPTAIGNPSLDSIEAALNPVQHDYYFYLADHKGVTYYSATYAEHLRKKNLYLGG